MNGNGIIHDTAVHMSSIHIPLNRAINTATVCVECAQNTEGGSRPACLLGLRDTLTKPTGKALIGKGLSSHAIPEANEQLLHAPDEGCEFKRVNWAKQMQSCLGSKQAA